MTRDAGARQPAAAGLFPRCRPEAEPAWREVVALAVEQGVPVPAFASSLAYYDGLRRARGPANLLQGLRDYFGAHTYRRARQARHVPHALGPGRQRGPDGVARRSLLERIPMAASRQVIVSRDPRSADTFDVVVRDSKSESRHRVTISAQDAARFAGAEPARCVEAAMAFLLDREPKESILAAFDIGVIRRYFPEFDEAFPALSRSRRRKAGAGG